MLNRNRYVKSPFFYRQIMINRPQMGQFPRLWHAITLFNGPSRTIFIQSHPDHQWPVQGLLKEIVNTHCSSSCASSQHCAVFFGVENYTYIIFHWIGLRENLQETMVFTIKYGAFL